MLRTQHQAEEQASESLLLCHYHLFLFICVSMILVANKLFLLTEAANHTPGMIEDLTDLLAEDWAKLGAVKEMGADTEWYFRQEMEKTWGAKHLAVFSEEEARKWVLGVSIPNISASCSVTSSTSRPVRKVAVRTSTSSSTLDHYLTIPLWFYLQALRLLKVSADLEAKVIALR